MNELFFVIWFFLPAGIANVTPIFAAHLPVLKNWNYPLDFFMKTNKNRIFGDHKTIRGFISGIILGTLASFLLFYTSPKLPNLPVWYYQTNPILLGVLLSFGALFGDAIKSFFKRQMHILPGKTWIPFDQIDYIVGGLFFSSFLHVLSLLDDLRILIVWVVIHIISTFLGYLLRLKDQPL